MDSHAYHQSAADRTRMLLVQVPDRPEKRLLMAVLMILLMILLMTDLLKMQKMKNWIFVRMTLKLSLMSD